MKKILALSLFSVLSANAFAVDVRQESTDVDVTVEADVEIIAPADLSDTIAAAEAQQAGCGELSLMRGVLKFQSSAALAQKVTVDSLNEFKLKQNGGPNEISYVLRQSAVSEGAAAAETLAAPLASHSADAILATKLASETWGRKGIQGDKYSEIAVCADFEGGANTNVPAGVYEDTLTFKIEAN